MSAELQQRLVQIGVPGQAIRVQHNGINVEQFALQDKQAARQATGLPHPPSVGTRRQIAIYVGNLKVSKGIMDLAEAARLLAAGGYPLAGAGAQRGAGPRDAPLIVLVGDGPARQLLAETVDRNALADHVLLVGARPHREIPDWIAAGDVLCLPSHQEGCPNVVLEALACGRPVVASRVGAVPELMDESCGALVSPKEPAELAAALTAVVSRDWNAAALRERVMPLSWAENARRLSEELEQVIREHRQAAGRGMRGKAGMRDESGPGLSSSLIPHPSSLETGGSHDR